MLFAQLLLVIGRHQWLTEAFNDLRLRVANGVAYVVFVRRDRLPAFKFHTATEHSHERRTFAALAVCAVTRDASLLLKNLLPGCDRRLLTFASSEPVIEFRRVHSYDPAAHARMVRAAVFGAEEMIATGLCGLEPHGRVATRHNVCFGAKRRNEEVVYDIFSRHDELDLATDRNM